MQELLHRARQYEGVAATLDLDEARRATATLARALTQMVEGVIELDRAGPQRLFDLSGRSRSVVDHGELERVFRRLAYGIHVDPPTKPPAP